MDMRSQSFSQPFLVEWFVFFLFQALLFLLLLFFHLLLLLLITFLVLLRTPDNPIGGTTSDIN